MKLLVNDLNKSLGAKKYVYKSNNMFLTLKHVYTVYKYFEYFSNVHYKYPITKIQ